MEKFDKFKAFICDMDGVIYHGNRLLPGVKEFVKWLQAKNKNFLFLTNSSSKTPRELRDKLHNMGLDVDESHFYTSALATAAFLKQQCPGGSAFVIGDTGVTNALYDAGFTMNNSNPDYVIVSESSSTYNYDNLERAINMVLKGAKLIGTNPDMTGPTETGINPGTGALIAPIELSTSSKAYFVGKPNPLMMRHALKRLNSNREDTAIIGDRMDTDIIAGIESEIATILVLSGVTKKEDIEHFAYRPTFVVDGVGSIPKEK